MQTVGRIITLAVLYFALPKSDGHHLMKDYKNHPCIRPCGINKHMTCEYNFTIEYYFTLTKACNDCPFNKTDCERPHCVPADGTPRALITVNRMLPGPAIHVCYNDTIIVNVYNRLEGSEGTSIHWHGIHQTESQHMDGVAMVTQCPILAYSSFQYKFKASTPGTHFWHAHSGLQRSDGVFGQLVIRQPPELEPHFNLYDVDTPQYTVLINDWFTDLSINKFCKHYLAGGDNKPASMLINDGSPVEPVEVESVVMYNGERYDIVIHTDQLIGNYWIRARGDADCKVKAASQLAILRYDGTNDTIPAESTDYFHGYRSGKVLNPLNKKGTDDLMQVSLLESKMDDDAAFKEIPDKKFYLAMDFYRVNNFRYQDPPKHPMSTLSDKYMYTPQINHISNILPPSPVLSQYKDIPNELICNDETLRNTTNCSTEYCECVHVLKVGLGDTVELVLIDEGYTYSANHPMHLHGNYFRVIGMDKLNTSTTLIEVKRLDGLGLLNRNLTKRAAKDTVTVPDGGYTIIRFHARNPGFWFFHCHIEFHAETGMGLVFQVGETHEHPKTPANFPKCGSWQSTDV